MIIVQKMLRNAVRRSSVAVAGAHKEARTSVAGVSAPVKSHRHDYTDRLTGNVATQIRLPRNSV